MSKKKKIKRVTSLQAPPPVYRFPLNLLYPLSCSASLLVVFFLAFFPVRSDDIYMYLSIGRIFAATGHFPAVDPFLFTIPDYHWNILHEWGNDLLSYKLFSLGGWDALVIFKTVVVLATASIPLFMAKQLKFRSPIVPFVIILASYAASSRFIERASLFSDLFTPLVLAILLLQTYRPSRLPLIFPLIFLIWVNTHPGFHIGLTFLALWIFLNSRRWNERPVQILVGSAFASSLACLLNPKGIKGFVFPLRTVFDKSWNLYRQFNFEWMPTLSTSYANTPDVKVFLLLAAGVIVLLFCAHKEKPWFEIASFLFLIYLGLSAIRFVSTTSFAMAVLATSLAARTGVLSLKHPDKALRTTFIWLTLSMLALSLIIVTKIAFTGYTAFSGPRHFGAGMDETFQPVKAADFLDMIDLKAPLFNQHDFGCYLAWRWNGRRKLFYHGAVDDLKFYNDDYLGVNRSPAEFDRIVNKYKIGAFMLTRYDVRAPALPLLYRTLLTRSDWHLVYLDDIAMIFLKDLPENQAAIRRYKLLPY